MDRNYYYRVLGVRSDATPAQIKAAYETRIARLSSADFADEPEYARRKKAQATKAYKVLLGMEPAATKAQKETRFEKHKDRIERREGFEIDDSEEDVLSKIKMSIPKINLGNKGIKNTADKGKFVVATTVISLVIAVIGLVSAIGDMSYAPDYSYDEFYYEDEIEDAEYYVQYFDYYDKLDTSTIAGSQGNIDWNEGIDVYAEEFGEASDLRYAIASVIYSFDIYDEEEFFYYITNDYSYYYWYDDYDCANALISWMGAPNFEEIAGATSLYSGQPILCLTDYMEFLEDFSYEHY